MQALYHSQYCQQFTTTHCKFINICTKIRADFKSLTDTLMLLSGQQGLCYINQCQLLVLRFICECETKEQSKQWMHIHSPNKQKMFKQRHTSKLIAIVFWHRKRIHDTKYQNNTRSVLRHQKWNTE
jgi:hypothetical protein